MRLQVKLGIGALATLGSLIVADVAAERWLSDVATRTDRCRRRAALERGLEYDGRSRLEVLQTLRERGIDAHPAVPISLLTEPVFEQAREATGARVVPLGGISRATIVLGNENGFQAIYESDRHGFNNPDEAWDAQGGTVLVGDSFVHGKDVAPGDDLAGVLRRRGRRALNLGASGAGPLAALAMVREYAAAVRPRWLVWVVYEGNDFGPPEPHLLPYLDPRHRQRLRARQPEIDRLLRDRVDRAITAEVGHTTTTPEWARRLPSPLKIAHLRSAVRRILEAKPRPPETLDWTIEAIRLAEREVDRWEGRLLVVAHPPVATIGTPQTSPLHGGLLAAMTELGIPVLDLDEVFAGLTDPTVLLPLGCRFGHHSPEGYAIVAKAIDAKLRSLEAP